MEYLVNEVERVWAGALLGASYICARWLLALCDHPFWAGDALAYALPNWWTVLVAECRVEAQVWQKDLGYRKNKSLTFSAFVTDAEGAVLYVCPGSYKFVISWKALKREAYKETSSGARHDFFTCSTHRPWTLKACSSWLAWGKLLVIPPLLDT